MKDYIGATIFKGVIEELGWDRTFTIALQFLDKEKAKELLDTYATTILEKQETIISCADETSCVDTDDDTDNEDTLESKRDEILADIELLKQRVISMPDQELLLTKRELQRTVKSLIELKPRLKSKFLNH